MPKRTSVSLSVLIENYLSSLTKKSEVATEVSPLVESLTRCNFFKRERLQKRIRRFFSQKIFLKWINF
jgi:hypothetical protein